MSKPIGRAFVGRDDPLNEFYRRFTYRRMRNGIYYWGGGGLGKTWLLQKIYDDALQDPTRTVPAIIDLFDTCNHSIRGLQATIRDRLNCSEVFRPYDEFIARIEQARASSTSTQLGAIASLDAPLTGNSSTAVNGPSANVKWRCCSTPSSVSTSAMRVTGWSVSSCRRSILPSLPLPVALFRPASRHYPPACQITSWSMSCRASARRRRACISGVVLRS